MAKKKYKTSIEELYDDTPSFKDYLRVAGIFLALPVFISLILGIFKIWDDACPRKMVKYEQYPNDYVTPEIPDYEFHKPSKIFSEPGVVLTIKGLNIQTDLDSDEILQQLSLDYQDLYDYYGGAEELY